MKRQKTDDKGLRCARYVFGIVSINTLAINYIDYTYCDIWNGNKSPTAYPHQRTKKSPRYIFFPYHYTSYQQKFRYYLYYCIGRAEMTGRQEEEKWEPKVSFFMLSLYFVIDLLLFWQRMAACTNTNTTIITKPRYRTYEGGTKGMMRKRPSRKSSYKINKIWFDCVYKLC